MLQLPLLALAPFAAPQDFEYGLRPPDRERWACAGAAVAIDGPWVFVGGGQGSLCPGTSDDLPALFRRDASGRNWDYVRALRPAGSPDFVTGRGAVDIDGGHMVAQVGTELRPFELDPVTDQWIESPPLVDPAAPATSIIADAVDIEGDLMLVIRSLPTLTRAAEIFEFDGMTGRWVHGVTLLTPNPGLTPWGWLDGTTAGLVVDHDDTYATPTRIWIHSGAGGAWSRDQVLDGAVHSSQPGGYFGASSDLEGDLLAVGDGLDLVLFERSGAGAPFVFAERLAADAYGSIDVEDGVVFGGAWPSGAVDVWRRAACLGGGWTRSHRLRTVEKHSGTGGFVGFGKALDVDGEVAVVGAPDLVVINGPNHGRRSGAASLFRVASDLDGNGVEDVCQIQSFTDDVDGDGLLDIVESPGSRYCSPNVPTSLGVPATILLQGSERVDENRLVVTMLGVPEGSYGLMIAGRQPGFLPSAGINDGNLCIAGGVARRPGRTHSYWFAGADNVVHQVFDTSFSPWGPGFPLMPGETWFFQGWFRDGGASNMTDAMRIFFE